MKRDQQHAYNKGIVFNLRLTLSITSQNSQPTINNTCSAFSWSPCSSYIIPKVWKGSEHFGTENCYSDQNINMKKKRLHQLQCSYILMK